MATSLLKIFLGQGLAKDFLDLLFQLELGRTSEAWEGVAYLRAWWRGQQEPRSSEMTGGEKSKKSSCRRLMGPIRRRSVRLGGKGKSRRQRWGRGLEDSEEALY